MTGGPDVLFVGHGAERSGPPILLRHLQHWLAANSDLSMATLVARGGPLVTDYEQIGPVGVVDGDRVGENLARRAVRHVGGNRTADRVDGVRARGAARSLGSPALVYANTVAPRTAPLVRAVLDDGAALLVHVHELASTLRNRIPSDHLAWLLGRADRILAASGAVRDELVGHFRVDPGRIAVCFEFVEPVANVADDERARDRLALGLDPDAAVIAASGRLDWRKAPELLGQALWRIRRQHPELDARVVWIGAGGDDRWQLEHDLESMGLTETFLLVGEQREPSQWVQVADVFALPSREDAFPLACLEAAGAEMPLVSFDTGGMVEFVAASGGGIVVPYPDIEAFAHALCGLLQDRDRRTRLGAAAAAHVHAHHTVDAGARPIHGEILDLLATRTGG